jgi:hypothetical protein
LGDGIFGNDRQFLLSDLTQVSGIVFRIFEAEFFLVPSKLHDLPDCQSIPALTDTETHFFDKCLLLIAFMIRLPAAIENIHLSPGAAEDTVAKFPTANCITTFLAIVSNVAPPAGKTYWPAPGLVDTRLS